MTETPLSSLAVYRARPTVRVNGQAYPKVSEQILGMQMTEAEGGLSNLELRLTNLASDPRGSANFAFEDGEVLELGLPIAVYTGDENDPQEIFQGHITGLEASLSRETAPELVVLAEDAFQHARMLRRTKVHQSVSIADLARDLANKLGLTPVVTGLTTRVGTQVQLNESDLAFLRRLLSRVDADLQVVGKELHVSPRSDVRRGKIDLVMDSQLKRVRVLADLAHQVTAVTVTGWDAKQGQRVSGRSTGAHLGPGTGRKGAALLEQTIGQRAHHISHVAVTTGAEAQAVADAAFDERARRLVCLEGTAEGNAALRVGANVAVSGLGPRFDNTYYVVRTCHHYEFAHGYQTTFDAECAYWGEGAQ